MNREHFAPDPEMSRTSQYILDWTVATVLGIGLGILAGLGF